MTTETKTRTSRPTPPGTRTVASGAPRVAAALACAAMAAAIAATALAPLLR